MLHIYIYEICVPYVLRRLGCVSMRVICKLCHEECIPTEVERYYNNQMNYSSGWECCNPDCDNDEVGDLSGLCENFIIDEGDDYDD